MATLSATDTLQIAFLQAVARNGAELTRPCLMHYIEVAMQVDNAIAANIYWQHIGPCLRKLRDNGMVEEVQHARIEHNYARLTSKGGALAQEHADLNLHDAIVFYLDWKGYGRQRSLFELIEPPPRRAMPQRAVRVASAVADLPGLPPPEPPATAKPHRQSIPEQPGAKMKLRRPEKVAEPVSSGQPRPKQPRNTLKARRSELPSRLTPRQKRQLQRLFEQPFDATSVADERKHVLRDVAQRRGQPLFRLMLLEIYGGQCAVTGCNAEEALEAAHIVGYKGEQTNHPANGLLLRADLHTLFDLGLIAIDTYSMSVIVAPTLQHTPYQDLAGVHLRPPREGACISTTALDAHRAWAERSWNRANT